jgi:ubiquitin carboxyl-terminal hydrolase 4/11/15
LNLLSFFSSFCSRFFFSHCQNKIESLVQFPLEHLDLTDVVKGPQEGAPAQYELFAVSEHMGGLGGGHYTAVTKNCKSGDWYACDDTRVTPLSSSSSTGGPESGVVTPHAYVLFYQRKAPPAKWAGMKPAKTPQGKSGK